jgi:hypothetical protein
MKNKPKSNSDKKSWLNQPSQNPFNLHSTQGKPQQFQARQVTGRRSQRGR